MRVAHPWDATIDLTAPEPARFYLGLIGQTLQFSAPASRRAGRAWAFLGRHGIPERALADVLRRVGGVLGTADQTSYVDAAARAWPELRARDPSLPGAPELSVLVLARSSAVTVFLFSGEPWPVLVGKLARGSSDGVAREVAAIVEAAPAGVAPTYFGPVDGLGEVQRGIPGRALRVEPVTSAQAGALTWTEQHRSLTEGFERLARATTKAEVPSAMGDDVVDRALAHRALTSTTRAAVDDAARALGDVPISVLRHTDSSPQNLLFQGSSLSGIVDWEDATSAGMPGADIWNAALGSIDKGVGLVRWNEASLVASFRAAWGTSPFGRDARLAGRRCARAAGVPAELHDHLEVLFFARRVGHRLARPDAFPTSADVAAAALEDVIAARRS